MEGELQEDWEVVTQEEDNSKRSLEDEIDDEDVTQAMTTFDYFSLENQNSACRVDEDGSVQSGSPGWIEPRSDVPYGPKHLSELWSDSSSDDQRLVGDDDVNNDLGLEKSGEYSEIIAKEEKNRFGLISSESDNEGFDTERVEESPVSFVWWKVPFEVLKYCVFRVNPIWSLSMAATVVGFVILGRRLYNMKKRKSPSMHLKLLLDDKKAANHGARLNEVAISLVKRVPIIRPALPSPVVGMNQWSMSLR